MTQAEVEVRIAEFIARYTPEMAAAIAACRKRMQALFPRGFELIYDNYNALVFGYSPTQRTPDAFMSLAAYPRWVTLFVLQGVDLADPESLLQGVGVQVRGIPLESPAQIDSPPVRALIAQAMAPVAAALAAAPELCPVVKSVSAKQRSRRPSPVKR